jgi:O-antigen/teichoic acid export membrane protein
MDTTKGRKNILKSSAWVFGSQIAGQILRLASNLIMTRLLVPEMFGVMTIANTVIVGLALCSYIGLHHNIIQNVRGDEPDFLNTAWTMQVIRGFLLWLIAILISVGLYFANQAGLFAEHSAYAEPSLPIIIAVLAFIPIISGFEPSKLATASRHMLVGKLAVIELSCQLLGLLTMISIALIHPSIWALVFGTLVSAFAKVIAGNFALPGPRNHFRWEKTAVYDLFHFGKWILLTTIMGFFVKSGDKLVLGALVSPQILGVYSIAAFMTTAFQDVLYRWAQSVPLPVLSRVHREGNVQALHDAYYRFNFPFNLATLFLAGFLFNAGYVIIDMLYDSRYIAAGEMIQILSVALIGARTILAEQLFLALGKPKLAVPMNILQLIVLFGGVVPAFNAHGIRGALVVIALTVISTLPLTWYYLKRFGILDWKKELITLPALFLGYGASRLFVILYEMIKASLGFT